MRDLGLPVVDLHNDLLTAVLHARERERETFASFWLPQLRAGGLTLQVLPFFTEEQFVGEGALRRCLRAFDLAWQLAGQHPDEVVVVESAADLPGNDRSADDRVRLLLALEGLEPVGHDLEVLRVLHRLGLRMAALTWNRRTMFADGQEQSSAGSRLTPLGVAAVEECERLGIVLDVSHLSDAGFWHLDEVATRPYVASHSSCRALVDHPRNLTDQQLRAVGAAGGVVGLNFWGQFLGVTPSHGADPVAAVDLAVDHVVHALEVAGESAVALGPDFMWDWTRTTGAALGGDLAEHLDDFTPPGLRRPDELPRLAGRLVQRVGAEVAAKVCSGNALRVFAEVL